MRSTSRRLSFRALVRALQCGLSTRTRRVAALLIVLPVVVAGGPALAQQGWPMPQPGAVGESGIPSIQPTIQGDTAAWAEVEAALEKPDSLSGYRWTKSEVGVFGEKKVTTIEAIPPNSFHVTIEQTAFSNGLYTIPSIAVESVTVNGETRSRTKRDGEPWGSWECPKAPPPVNPRSASVRRTVEVSRGPDTAIEGTPVRTYVYTTTFPDNKVLKDTLSKNTLYVDTQTGLPRRKVAVTNVGSHIASTSTEDYYYDAKIEITLPPCEKET